MSEPTELGRLIIQAKGRMGLRPLSRRVHMSKSALDRVILGQTELMPEQAARLDDALHTEGAIQRHVELTQRIAATEGMFREAWIVTFPADYSGPVWTSVTPSPEHAGIRHQLSVTWGPWSRTWVDVLPEAGAAYAYGKGDDGASYPVRWSTAPAARVVAQVGYLLGTVDINPGWFRVD